MKEIKYNKKLKNIQIKITGEWDNWQKKRILKREKKKKYFLWKIRLEIPNKI